MSIENLKIRATEELQKLGYTLDDFEAYLRNPVYNEKNAYICAAVVKAAEESPTNMLVDMVKAPASAVIDTGKALVSPAIGTGNLLGMQIARRWNDVQDSGNAIEDLEYRLAKLRQARANLDLMKRLKNV